MIAIIDYDAGNLTSVARALKRLNISCEVTRDPETIEKADRIIFPGVGAAGSAMESLKKYGLDELLVSAYEKGRPLLGICLGTQVIMDMSRENNTDCLGIIKGKVLDFKLNMKGEDGSLLKVPHMGWNNVILKKAHPVFKDVLPLHQFYFVHSYYPEPLNENEIIAETDYGVRFASVIGRDNLVATQFHPEKSGEPGLKILENFASWSP